jgi:hypothetical protein
MHLPGVDMLGVFMAVPPAAAKASSNAINVQSGKTYEEEFDLETKRMAAPKVKNTPWGSSYRAAPEILHGEQWFASRLPQRAGGTASQLLYMVCGGTSSTVS